MDTGICWLPYGMWSMNVLDAESVPGSATHIDSSLFYHTIATSTGLPCPPYVTTKTITCVVCTK